MLERKESAKRSADFISSILAESGAAAFSFAERIIEEKGVVMSGVQIEQDMYDRAASTHAKRFVESSAHSAFLQESRKKGRMGTMVVNPSTQKLIDTCSFGNSSARHHADKTASRERAS